MSRRWVPSSCRRTAESDRRAFCSVMRALKTSMPPYLTEYRGGLPPSRMSGRCVNASASHVLTCARMARTDQSPVTPGFISCASDKPAYDSSNALHAVSSRRRSCRLSTESGRLPERQVDTVPARQGMMSWLERHDAVIPKSGGTSPDHHVAVSQRDATWRIRSTEPAEQEDGRQSERDRHDRRGEILLVLVLVERQAGSRLVSVDEARVGSEAVESRPRGRLGSEVGEHVGHRRPATPALRVMAVVAIPGSIGDPAGCPAVRHRHGHPVASRRDHVAKRRTLDNPPQRGDEASFEGLREPTQHYRARRERHVPALTLEQVRDHVAS